MNTNTEPGLPVITNGCSLQLADVINCTVQFILFDYLTSLNYRLYSFESNV